MADKIAARCEDCVYFDYDEEFDDYVCEQSLDEDELALERELSEQVHDVLGVAAG